MQVHSEIQITIEKMAQGGYGIAKHDGLVIFIPHSAPGDQGIIKIKELKKIWLGPSG